MLATEFCRHRPCALVGADYQIALELLQCKPSRLYYIGQDQHPPGSKPLRLPSCAATALIDNKSLACIFLAQPTYEDMCAWWPKVAVGGCLMGRLQSPLGRLALSYFSELKCGDVSVAEPFWVVAKRFGTSIEILPDCDVAIISGDCGASTWAHQLRRLDADEAMLARLTALIPSNTMVIDAGAFIGGHTKAYQRYASNVWAFEPNPTAYACLCYNCPEAKTFNLALGDKEEDRYWTPIYPNCGGSFLAKDQEQHGTLVPVKPLDSFFYSFCDRIGFIKVDIEGMELQFLRGAQHTLQTHKPVLCLEVNTDALARNSTTPQALLAALDYLGFRTEPIWPGKDQEYQWDVIAIPKIN